jgi:hypothetical protein
VLLVVAGLIGVASVVAIAFALRGSGSGGPVTFTNNTGSPPPVTNVAPTTPPQAKPPEVATAVPPLTNPQVHPPVPNVPGHPTAPPPARYNGPECVRAREFKQLGHAKEAESWALACIAKGGQP